MIRQLSKKARIKEMKLDYMTYIYLDSFAKEKGITRERAAKLIISHYFSPDPRLTPRLDDEKSALCRNILENAQEIFSSKEPKKIIH